MTLLGAVESWSVNPVDVGPLYPWVGSEFFFYIVCVLLWIGWTIWQMKAENKQYAEETAELRRRGDFLNRESS